jgi:peptidoglycan/LPS O-acetylase OafA/YrhL
MQFNKISILSEKPIVRKTIQYVASLVFGVYLVHMMIIEFMDRYTSIIPGKVQSPMWGYVFLKTIVVIGLAFGIVAVGKKIPYIKYLFA